MPEEKKTCTAPDCNNKHFAKGLCHKHYRQETRRRKGENTDEPKSESDIPKYIPPEEIKIGVQGPNAVDGGPVQPDPNAPKPPAPIQYAVGTLQIEMAWEVLNRMAPNSAIKLELTPVQRQALDQAFIQAGLTTTNPWIIIVSIVAFPTIVFILLNYEQIKLGAKGMIDDFKNAFTVKKKVTAGLPLV